VAVGAGFHEGGLVEPDGRRLVQPLAVGLEQRLAVRGDRVISGWPLLKDPLLRDLDVVFRRDYFRKGAGCERCSDYSVVEIGFDGL
jgi:hypothetical protein